MNDALMHIEYKNLGTYDSHWYSRSYINHVLWHYSNTMQSLMPKKQQQKDTTYFWGSTFCDYAIRHSG